MQGPSNTQVDRVNSQAYNENYFHGDIDVSDENIKFLFDTGYTLDQVLNEFNSGHLQNFYPATEDDFSELRLDRDCTSTDCCSKGKYEASGDLYCPSDIIAGWNSFASPERQHTNNQQRKINPGQWGMRWIAKDSGSGTPLTTNDLKPWISSGDNPCYDNFCGPQTSTSNYDNCRTWQTQFYDDQGHSLPVDFSCYLEFLGRQHRAADSNAHDVAVAQNSAGPDTPLLYVGFVAAGHDFRCGNRHYSGKKGWVELPDDDGNRPWFKTINGAQSTSEGINQLSPEEVVAACWNGDNNGFDERLPWKNVEDVLDAFATSSPVPRAIVQFWAQSARSLPYDPGFPATGFNWTHVFPGLFVRHTPVRLFNDPMPNYPAVMKRRRSGEESTLLQAVWTTGARKQDDPMPCQYDQEVNDLENPLRQVDNTGWKNCATRTAFRLTPAMFTVPTHFRRDGLVWSFAFLGDDGLWAVPAPFR